MDSEKTSRVKVEADLVARNEIVAPQIDKAKAAAVQAGDDLMQERVSSRRLVAISSRRKVPWPPSSKRPARTGKPSCPAPRHARRHEQAAHTMSQLADGRGKQLEDVKKETFEVADGEITWVNQRNGTVWINLGRADSLGRQTSFSVYAADTNDRDQVRQEGEH